jgi:gluconolactonase
MLKCNVYHRCFQNLIEIDQDQKKIGEVSIGAMAWTSKEKKLDYFDARTGKKFVWTPAEGQKMESASPGKFIDMTYDWCGRLLACHGEKNCIVRYQRGIPRYFADSYNGQQLQPIAISTHSCGNIYMADKSGIYYVLLERLIVVLASQNEKIKPVSLCVSADEDAILFTNENSETVSMMNFALDGTLQHLRTMFFAGEFPKGAPTDIKVDLDGNIYCAAPTGVHIFDKAGLRIGIILMESTPVKLCFGNEDAKTLFIGTKDGICTLAVKIRGRI